MATVLSTTTPTLSITFNTLLFCLDWMFFKSYRSVFLLPILAVYLAKSFHQQPCHNLNSRLPWNFLCQCSLSPLNSGFHGLRTSFLSDYNMNGL
jgi:hypothetical protein